MNIVVTGGAGFIGSHVTELLCDLHHSVSVLDDLSFGYKDFVDPRAKLFVGSLHDNKFVESVLDGVDIVMHLAASSIISFSFENPQAYFENNLINGVILLEAMRKKKVKKIIYSSTAAVYGEPLNIPILESDPKKPTTIYGASKLAFEEALQAYYHAFGLESVSLRYYNAYGPRDEQKPATRAIPMWIDAILHKKVVPWYWRGRQIRDYVYVKDIAKAHVAVMNLSGLHTFNIGSGQGIVMKDILVALGKIVGRKIATQDMGERKGDPMRLVADITAIQKTVGWRPMTDLTEGLAKTFAYYQQKYNK